MSASTHNQPRYYGSLFNLEHRVMSGAVVTLAVIVLVLFGAEGRAVPSGLGIVEIPAVDAFDGELDGWVRPVEIRVKAPSANALADDLDEWLLTPVRLAKPRQPAVARMEAASEAGSVEPTVVPARPAAVQVGPPAVASFELRESLRPVLLRAPVAPANGPISW